MQSGGLPAGWCVAVTAGDWVGQSGLDWCGLTYLLSLCIELYNNRTRAASLPRLEESVRKIRDRDVALQTSSTDKYILGMGQIKLLVIHVSLEKVSSSKSPSA